jgi:hypothetical protein
LAAACISNCLYSLNICTLGFLRRHLAGNPYFASGSLIVVESFDDKTIAATLDQILPQLPALAIQIE